MIILINRNVKHSSTQTTNTQTCFIMRDIDIWYGKTQIILYKYEHYCRSIPSYNDLCLRVVIQYRRMLRDVLSAIKKMKNDCLM